MERERSNGKSVQEAGLPIGRLGGSGLDQKRPGLVLADQDVLQARAVNFGQTARQAKCELISEEKKRTRSTPVEGKPVAGSNPMIGVQGKAQEWKRANIFCMEWGNKLEEAPVTEEGV